MECENVDKAVQYSSICYASGSYTMYVCGFSKEQSVIRQVDSGRIMRQIAATDQVFTKVILQAIFYSIHAFSFFFLGFNITFCDHQITVGVANSSLIAGTGDGRLVTYSLDRRSGAILDSERPPVLNIPAHIGAMLSVPCVLPSCLCALSSSSHLKFFDPFLPCRRSIIIASPITICPLRCLKCGTFTLNI